MTVFWILLAVALVLAVTRLARARAGRTRTVRVASTARKAAAPGGRAAAAPKPPPPPPFPAARAAVLDEASALLGTLLFVEPRVVPALGGAFTDTAGARRAIVLAEVLGPPLALR